MKCWYFCFPHFIFTIKGESQQVEAELWPQAVSSAIPDIIKMMDDVLVDSDKIAGWWISLLQRVVMKMVNWSSKEVLSEFKFIIGLVHAVAQKSVSLTATE